MSEVLVLWEPTQGKSSKGSQRLSQMRRQMTVTREKNKTQFLHDGSGLLAKYEKKLSAEMCFTTGGSIELPPLPNISKK